MVRQVTLKIKRIDIFSIIALQAMEMGLTRALLCILLLQGKLWLISCLAHCSCYTFHDTSRNRWPESNRDCETRNGTLVSMETEDEWNFITSEIKKINSTANKLNEWSIGLSIARKEFEKYSSLEDRRKAGWTWTSGRNLTIYSKWQPNEPNNRSPYDRYCAAISKNWPKGKYGFIKDVYCYSNFPYICEYDAGNKVNTSLNPVCWSNSSSKIRLTSCTEVNIPTTVITTTTSKIDATTTLPVQVYSIERTTAITTTQMSSKTTPSKFKSLCKEPVSSKYYVIAITVLAVVLVMVTGILAVVCCRMRKMKGKSSLNQRSSQVNNIEGPETATYAEVNDDPTSAYDEVQLEYLNPDDNTSPPPTGLYADLDESRRQHTYLKLIRH